MKTNWPHFSAPFSFLSLSIERMIFIKRKEERENDVDEGNAKLKNVCVYVQKSRNVTAVIGEIPGRTFLLLL